jgi:predicted dehydrogenase
MTVNVRTHIASRYAPDSDAPRVSKIRAGIVGAGLMGRWHAYELEMAGGIVVGVVDRERAIANRLTDARPASKSYESVDEMFSDAELDVLHICTPTSAHEGPANAAIRAGVHLLVEKPVVASAARTAELYRLADASGTFICPVHQYAFQKGVEQAKNWLPNIGRLIQFEAVINSAGGVAGDPDTLDMIASDILPHPLSLAQRFISGAISETAWSVLHPAAGELTIYGQTSDAVTMSIRISMNARPTKNSLSLVGTGGTIDLDLFHGYAVLSRGGTSRVRKLLRPFEAGARSMSAAGINLVRRSLRREPAYPGLRSLIGSFYAAIRSGGEQPFKPQQVIEVSEIRDLIMGQAGILNTGANAR